MYSIGTQVLLSLVTIVLWGISTILSRLFTDMVNTRVFLIMNAFIQSTATCVINSVIYRNEGLWREVGREMFIKAEWKRWVIILSNGIFCLSVPFILYNNLVSNTRSVAVIVCTTWYGAPIITSLLGWWVLGQKITMLQGGGMLLCIGGVVMMNVEVIRDEEQQALL